MIHNLLACGRTCAFNLLLAVIVCALHAPAAAQPPRPDDSGDISRTCLWNADRTTWSELNVNRAQIERLNEIRQRYPAVVDGRWLSEEEEGALSGPVHAPGSGWGIPPASPATTTGLQAELREVLTKKQLGRWHQLCAAPGTE